MQELQLSLDACGEGLAGLPSDLMAFGEGRLRHEEECEHEQNHFHHLNNQYNKIRSIPTSHPRISSTTPAYPCTSASQHLTNPSPTYRTQPLLTLGVGTRHHEKAVLAGL